MLPQSTTSPDEIVCTHPHVRAAKRCQSCYGRYYSQMMRQRSFEPRFWAKVDKGGPGDCWVWTAKANRKGYGQFCIHRRYYYAHRVSYELHIGPVPDGFFVCHRCDNPPCVNPAHLFLGTLSDNAQDSIAKGRFRTKINAKIAEQIRQEYRRGGIGQIRLGAKYGLGHSHISRIVRGLSWREGQAAVMPLIGFLARRIPD